MRFWAELEGLRGVDYLSNTEFPLFLDMSVFVRTETVPDTHVNLCLLMPT